MTQFNNTTVNVIKTVIRFVLVQYRDADGTLISSMRALAGEARDIVLHREGNHWRE